MIKLKRYSRPYNSLLIFSVLFILACGPIAPPNEFPGYFMPQSGYTPQGALPYFYTPDFLYLDYYDYDKYNISNDPNLESWKKELEVKVSDSLAARFIYQGKDDPANPLYRAIQKRPAAWSYLLLARKIQEASASGGNRWDPVPADTPAMRKCFSVVKERLKKQTGLFLKEKYAFQAIKLAHELHLYDSCIALYNRYFGDQKKGDVMKYWSLSRKGGALLDKGDTAQAVYTFAQVYDQCPTRRKQAYMSLRLNHIRFVPAALKYCKTDQEKLAVYTLCAIQPWQDALPLMQQMVKLAPNHPYLELIMGREINKNEKDYYSRPNGSNAYYSQPDTTELYKKREQALDYFEKLGRFASQCTENDQINDKAFWYTAAAYINYVQGAHKQSAALLARAEKEPAGNPVLQQQILLQKLLLATDDAGEITPRLEQQVLPLLDSMSNSTSFYKNNALVYSCMHLADLYRETASKAKSVKTHWWSCNRPEHIRDPRFASAKAFLLTMLTTGAMNDQPYTYFMNTHSAFSIEDTTSNTTLDNVIAFYEQPDPTPEDLHFMRLTSIRPDYLYWIKGRRAMSLFHYGQAAKSWQHVSDSFWHQEPFTSYLASDPFTTGIKDGNNPAKTDVPHYTPYQIAKRMETLSGTIKTNPDQAAQTYYMLGCAAYNMSYYGNSWLLVKRSWSGAELPYFVDGNLSRADSLNYYTANQARAYFDSAMKRATDKEMAAKACFMAAKCEQKAYYLYVSRRDDDARMWNAQFRDNSYFYGSEGKRRRDSLRKEAERLANTRFHHYFKIFNRTYSNTEYAADVIRECALYRDFAVGR